jgi:hypothetical protein
MMMQVDHLTKVQLTLAAGQTSEEMDLIAQPIPWSFVTGASAEGLAPFEMACQGRSSGDEVCVEIPARQAQKIFEHLRPPILSRLPEDQSIFVKAVVTKVEAASSREVVRAMAEAVDNGAGGCGGSCGCGC